MNVVFAEYDVHEAGDAVGGFGVLVEFHALYEGRCTVANTDDGDANLVVSHF